MKNKIIIIAEAGVNHNGSLKLAKKLIDVAKKAGADFIKFQIFKSENVVTNTAPLAEYQVSKKYKSQKELIRSFELSKNDFFKINQYCKKKKINFLCTPFDNDSLNFLIKDLKLNNIKLSSGDINNFPMIYRIGKEKINLILSTGMSNIIEIEMALKFYLYGYFFSLKKIDINNVKLLKLDKYLPLVQKKLSLLHCISSYPTPLDDVNIKNINTLNLKFKDLDIGFSDHTVNIETPLLAIGSGAKMIEKHFTLSKRLKGPDHKASLNPKDLDKMVKLIRLYDKSMGTSKIIKHKSEKNNLSVVRRSIYANSPININDKFNENNLILKRPYINSSNPIDYFDLIGKKSKRKYKKDQLIRIK